METESDSWGVKQAKLFIQRCSRDATGVVWIKLSNGVKKARYEVQLASL